MRTITVSRPEPGEAVIAVCGEDGARAWTVARKETLADEGVLSQILAGLAEVQAEVRPGARLVLLRPDRRGGCP
jgi:hypothetical protein